MVGSWYIPSTVTFEAVIANKNIFERYSKAMSDMEVAIGIRWWHDDSVRGGVALPFGRKRVRGFPKSINVGFVLVGLIGFAEFHIRYYIIR